MLMRCFVDKENILTLGSFGKIDDKNIPLAISIDTTKHLGNYIRKIRKVLNLHLSYLLLFKCNKCKLRGRPYFFCT